MNKNSDPVQNFFLIGGWENGDPNSNLSKLLELLETSRAGKLIFGLQVNIDMANSRRFDVTRHTNITLGAQQRSVIHTLVQAYCIYTLFEKRWHFIFDYNSRIFWSIVAIFTNGIKIIKSTKSCESYSRKYSGTFFRTRCTF